MDFLHKTSQWSDVLSVQSVILDNSLAVKTVELYQVLFQDFVDYCYDFRIVPETAQQQQILNWITCLFINGRGYYCVPALSALKHEFVRKGWSTNQLEMPRLKLFVDKFDLVYKKEIKQRRRRDAFAVDILICYYDEVLKQLPITYSQFYNLCVIVIAMRLGLRPGELGLLQVQHVHFEKDFTGNDLMKVTVTRLKSGKHVERKVSEVPVEQSFGRICPVKLMQQYLLLLQQECATFDVEFVGTCPLFPVFTRGKIFPISRIVVDKILKSIQQQVASFSQELAALKLTPHSLRIGSATLLSQLGIPTDIIKAICAWSENSEVYMRYIRTHAATRLQVSRRLFDQG